MNSPLGTGENPLLVVTGTNQGDLFGWNVSGVGDVNGDGFDDFVVGAPGYDLGTGRAYIYFGGPWFSGQLNAQNANMTLNGTNPGDRFGWDVSGAGDVNGDGLDDIVIGAPGNTSKTGSAYIYYGRKFELASLKATSANFTVLGEYPDDMFGASVSRAGDVNNDGFADVIVGSPGFDKNTGKAYIFLGNETKKFELSASVADIMFWGENMGDFFGFSVSDAGDVNGDEFDDVIVGAPGTDRAYVYYGGDPVNAWFTTNKSDYDSAAHNVHIDTTLVIDGEAQLKTFHNIKALMAYFDGSNPPDTPEIPKNRTWNQQIWSFENKAYSIGSDENYWFVVESGTVRKNEKILGVSDAGVDILVQVSDGLSWGHTLELTDVVRDNKYRGFDIAYESLSGDALFAYYNDTSLTKFIPKYRMWNGTAWSPEMDALPVGSADIHWVSLASHPFSDEVLMVTLDRGNKDIYAQVWNGSAWGDVQPIEGDASRDDNLCFDVAYEQQTGNAIIVWGGDKGSNKNLNYRRWTGDWSEPAGILPAADNQVNVVKLATDPRSDFMILGHLDNGRRIDVQVWNGSNWSAPAEVAPGNAERNNEHCFDVAYEAAGDREGMVVYGIGNHRPAYRIIDGTSVGPEGFVLDANPPDNGRNPNWIILESDPQTSEIMLTYIIDDGGGNGGAEDDLGCEVWNGTEWKLPQRVELNCTRDTGQHFDVAYTDTSGYLISAPYDAGIEGEWGRITWTADVPRQTTLSFRTRTSRDGVTWGSWTEWYGNRDRITSPNERWIQYEAYFSTTNVTRTPVLYDVTIELNRANLTINGTPGEGFGWSVSQAWDLHSDGYDDLIIGAPLNGTNNGSAYIFSGSRLKSESEGDRFINLTGGETANVTLRGDTMDGLFGYSVSWAGNASNDKYPDVLVGAPGAQKNGATYLFFGSPLMNPVMSVSDADVTITGEGELECFGWSVAWAGNISSIGYDEIAIGAPFNDDIAKTDAGRMYIFSLHHRPDVTINSNGGDEYYELPLGSQVNLSWVVPGNNVSFILRLENDGTLQDSYEIDITTGLLAGWTRKMTDDMSGGEITDGHTINMPPGSNRTCTLNISVPISAVHMDESWITVIAVSQNDTTKRDAVKAIVRALDIIPPEILDTTSGTPATGDIFTVSAMATDNVMVSDVNLYYWFDLFGGGVDGPYNATMGPGCARDVTVPSEAIALHYNISANDTSDNWNGTGVFTLSVFDNDQPSVIDTTVGPPSTGELFPVTAIVTDNIDVDEVYLYYWIELFGGGTDGPYIVPMDSGYGKDINVPSDAVHLHYNISANDTTDSWNETGIVSLIVLDDDIPGITDTTAGVPSTGDTFLISAIVNDNIDVDQVFIYYWFALYGGGKDGPFNLTMDPEFSKNLVVPVNAVNLHYQISANDTSNNWNLTIQNDFAVLDNDKPVITDSTTGIPTTGDVFSVSGTINDNIEVDQVFLYFWFDLVGGGTDGPYNITMGPGYTKDVNVPSNAIWLHYHISANDTSDKWGQTAQYDTIVMDNDLPDITDTTIGLPTTGDMFTITSLTSDNIDVEGVHLYYWFDLYGGGLGGPYNLTMDPGHTRDVNVPSNAVWFHYHISVTDTSDNWNQTIQFDRVVHDNDLPDISDTTSGEPTTGDSFTITTTVTDNIDVDLVCLYYWFDLSGGGLEGPYNVSMEPGYTKDVNGPSSAVRFHYYVSANDTSENWKETTDLTLDVIDNDEPHITNVDADPTVQEINSPFNFTATATDNIGVAQAGINITYPNGSWLELFLYKGSVDQWYLETSFDTPGDYGFKIWAVDSQGNRDISSASVIRILPPSAPTIDYIQIRTEANGGGEVIETMTYDIDDIDIFHASGYNSTAGYLGDLECDWLSNNVDAGSLSTTLGFSTNFTATAPGSGVVYVIYGTIMNQTAFEISPPQEPDIIGVIPNINMLEDFDVHIIDLVQFAHDGQDPKNGLMWYITGENNTILHVFGENQTGNHQLGLISLKDEYGTMEATYWLVDSEGNTASQKAWINVTPVNDAPRFAPSPDLYVHFDSQYPFDYSPYISDIDTDFQDLLLTCDDSEYTTVNGLIVIYSYPENMLDDRRYVTLTISDGESAASQLIMVTVTSDYPPVTLNTIPDVTIYENKTLYSVFDLDDYIMDPDGDSLYMSYGYTHLNITIQDNHSVDFAALGEWTGKETVTFRAEDPTGAIVEQTIIVDVIPVNDPPVLKTLPPLVVHFDHPFEFDLFWYISDNDNTLEDLVITTSNPDNVTVKGTVVTLLYPEFWEGRRIPYNISLTVTVSDGTHEVSRNTTVKVGSDYPPTMNKELEDLFFNEDESVMGAFDLDEYFNDSDGNYIFYSSGNIFLMVVINENHSVDFIAPRDWYGSEYITIRATDEAGGFAEDTILVSVIPINDPPYINDIPHQVCERGKTWVFDLIEYLSDIDNAIDTLKISVDSPYISVVGHILIFNYPENMTEDTVPITVSDGEHGSSTTIDITITSPSQPPREEVWFWYLIIIALIATLLLVLLAWRGVYTLEDLFLVTNSGLLVEHAGLPRKLDKNEKDDDLLAAMFVAVQEFIKDAFAREEGENLKRMDYGDKTVMIYKGKYLILSAFISGKARRSFYDSMREFVEGAETYYKEFLESGGNMTMIPLHDAEAKLALFLSGKYTKGDWGKLGEVKTHPDGLTRFNT